MGIFSISDIIISLTLIINALALVSSSIRRIHDLVVDENKDRERNTEDSIENNGGHKGADNSLFVPQKASSNSTSPVHQTINSAVSNKSEVLASNLFPPMDVSKAMSPNITTSGSEHIRDAGNKNLHQVQNVSFNTSLINPRSSSSSSMDLSTASTKSLGSSSLSIRLDKFMNSIRRMSCLIVLWNIFFIILMIFIFGD